MSRADEIRAAHARHRDRRTVECAECVLLDEIDVLRRLPVIATCEGCRAIDYNVCRADDDDFPREVDPKSVPPDWCPLRGAR